LSGLALSVVVAPVSRGAFLAAALQALEAQTGAPAFEVIVPFDDSVEGIDGLRARFPEVTYLAVEGTAALGRSGDPGVAHLAIDRRRAAALAAARGDVVALTDEWSLPAADWCAELVRAHRAPHAVIGGAIACGRDRTVNWALFFMDAGRYQNPLPEGPAVFVTDVNVSYKRTALERCDVWRKEYHETRLHDALRAQGQGLWLTPRLVVAVDRRDLGLAAALRERFAWARLYAGRRAREVPAPTRALLALGAPLLAAILPWRQFRMSWKRGAHRGAFLRCLPVLLLMDLVWAAGETTGYLTARGTSAG